MGVDINKLGHIFGDRLLVKKLERPDKVRGLFIPASAAKDKAKEQDLWWGIVERFGLDSKIGDAYGVHVGDLVGFESAGQHCSTFLGEDGAERVWVAEEFAAVKDLGRVAAFRDGQAWTKEEPGIQPLGPRVAILPDEDDNKSKGGVYIPDTAGGKTNTGTTIAVSLGKVVGSEMDKLLVEIGDRILYSKYSGCFARLGDTNILLACQDDVIGIFSPDPKEVACA